MNSVAARLSLIPVLLLLFVACTPVASGDSRSVVVERRDGDITVLENGDIDIVETWQIHFQGSSFRRGYRTIPLKPGSSVSSWAVSEPGLAYRQNDSNQAGTFTVSTSEEDVTLRWYFSAASNAIREFELRYRLHGALRVYPDGDQVWLKFIESGRDYPINTAHVVVHLPRSFAADQLQAATYLNRVDHQGAVVQDGQTVVFDGGPFEPHDEWEIRAQFPHGVVTADVMPWQLIEDKKPVRNMIALFSALIIGVVGFSGLYLFWDMYGRERPVGKVARYYTRPPDDTPPGMVGILIDERADLRDIVATVIDLARRGFIRITELKSPGFLGDRDTAFVRTEADQQDLLPYEQKLLGVLFGIHNERYLSDLRNSFHARIPYLKQLLYEEAVQRGYFGGHPQRTRVLLVGFGLCVLSLIILAGVVAYSRIALYVPYAIWAFGAAAVVVLGFVVLAWTMPRKTIRGATKVARWRAFKRYLEHIERYTRVADVRQYFDLYLPYAMAFGFERNLVQKFAAAETPVPDWYEPNPIYLGPSLDSHIDGSRGLQTGWAAAGGVAAPSFDSLAHGLTTGLDAICNDFCTMLDATSTALTSQVNAFDMGDGRDGLLNWIGRDSDDTGFGDWSGGGGFGGGGFGGGSSGFD